MQLFADWNLSNTKFDFAFCNPKKITMDKFFQPYDKECMKMVLLKHEETFKEQVYELHRLYQIQKMLMKNLQSSLHNHQENICFNNNNQQNNKIDLEQPARHDHDTQEDEEIEEDECEIELTLAPTSFNRRRRTTSGPESSDSVPSFSSSSTGSNNIKKVQRITRENSNVFNSSSDISLKHPSWMHQVLSLNMT